MPKRPKNGPPYTDIPNEVYVVVTHPWGMDRNPRSRGVGDFNRVASWARFALQQSGLCGERVPMVECIYNIGTRDEVILQFEKGTNIIPLLGEHRWANFWRNCPNPNESQSTCVFLYNWRNNGDPANHNWIENYPSLLPLNTVPAISPYPPPSWISPPSTLTNFVQPIPRPPITGQGNHAGRRVATSSPTSTVTTSPAPPQQSDQQETEERPVEQSSASTNLFTPYAPPTQHPSHARFLKHSEGQRETEPSSSPSLKFIKKLDPYELDEDALNFIRATDPPEEDVKDVKSEAPQILVKAEFAEIKTEEDNYINSTSEYQPCQDLIEAINSLHQPEPKGSPPPARPLSRDVPGCSAGPKSVPPASLGYQPSAELEASINALLQGETTVASPFPSGRNARLARVSVKREYEDDQFPLPCTTKRIKIEED